MSKSKSIDRADLFENLSQPTKKYITAVREELSSYLEEHIEELQEHEKPDEEISNDWFNGACDSPQIILDDVFSENADQIREEITEYASKLGLKTDEDDIFSTYFKSIHEEIASELIE